jgi:membrane complex biogenesis BtpA family protein
VNANSTIPRLIGMVHLDPLPGSPGFSGSIDRVVDRALRDATVLTEAGFPALMVENFGDAPFFPDDVPAITVAAMTRVTTEMTSVTPVPIGINVLRNDGLSAVAIAAAVGAGMIRVNVLSGTMYTDQGPIVGRAAEIARSRSMVAPGVLVLADVFVKHASPPTGLTLEQSAVDTWERGGAHALVVSGSGTGRSIDLADARLVRKAVPEAPIVVGSGATSEFLSDLVEAVDAAIVGTSIKVDGVSTNPVDPARAARFIEAASKLGWS